MGSDCAAILIQRRELGLASDVDILGFSSFGLETIRIMQAEEWMSAVTYVLLSNGFGVLAVILGLKIAG